MKTVPTFLLVYFIVSCLQYNVCGHGTQLQASPHSKPTFTRTVVQVRSEVDKFNRFFQSTSVFSFHCCCTHAPHPPIHKGMGNRFVAPTTPERQTPPTPTIRKYTCKVCKGAFCFILHGWGGWSCYVETCWICMQQLLSSNCSSDTKYSDTFFWFSSAHPGKHCDSTSVRRSALDPNAVQIINQ